MECLRRQHDCIATTADILGYFEKPTPVVFLEVEEKYLSVDGEFFGRNRIHAGFLSLILIHNLQLRFQLHTGSEYLIMFEYNNVISCQSNILIPDGQPYVIIRMDFRFATKN
jgi:hypothetical protein